MKLNVEVLSLHILTKEYIGRGGRTLAATFRIWFLILIKHAAIKLFQKTALFLPCFMPMLSRMTVIISKCGNTLQKPCYQSLMDTSL